MLNLNLIKLNVKQLIVIFPNRKLILLLGLVSCQMNYFKRKQVWKICLFLYSDCQIARSNETNQINNVNRDICVCLVSGPQSMGSEMMKDVLNAFPGIDEVMGFAEVMK